MPSFNRVFLIGRLTRDPEMRYTTSGLAVTTFSLAVDRRFKNQSGEKQTDFFRCKAWRQKAEFVSNYVTKGRLVAVEGSIETSEVVGQDGQKKYFTDIVCDQIELLESNREHAEGGAPAGESNYGGNANYGGSRQSTPAGGQADDGNGYFPDDDMTAAPPTPAPQPRQQRPSAPQNQGNPNQSNANQSNANQSNANQSNANQSNANQGSANQGGSRPATRAPQGGNRPAPRPEPAYPADDYDDSDPFADE